MILFNPLRFLCWVAPGGRTRTHNTTKEEPMLTLDFFSRYQCFSCIIADSRPVSPGQVRNY